MRDVTPVEALDTKLRCCMVRSGMDENGTPRAVEELQYVRSAIPVAWGAACFDAVRRSAWDYPMDVWPPIADAHRAWHLHVLPDILVFVGRERDGEFGTDTVHAIAVCIEDGFLRMVSFNKSLDPLFVVKSSMSEPPNRHYDDPLGMQEYRRLVSFVLAAWAFMDQRIAIQERAPAPRPSRRRAERLDVDPVVHVVRLRKSEARAHDGDGSHDVEWTCQWLVRGHWRNQWHPRMQRHASVWITPHIKGPADMPLKTPAPEVWQVAR